MLISNLNITNSVVTRSSSIFDPLVNPKLIAAYESDDVVLNGSTVSQLTDKSGNGHHFVQATAASQPTLNGDSIEFDGVDDYLELLNIADFKTISGECITIARSLDPYPQGQSRTIVFEAADSGTNDAFDRLWFTFSNTGEYSVVQSDDTSTVIDIRSTDVTTFGTYYITSFIGDNTSYSFYSNGSNAGVRSQAGVNDGKWIGGFTATAGLARVTLGRDMITNDSHKAEAIKAIYFFKQPLSTTERQNYVNYLNDKYNVF